jgi:hypothetical protein
MYQAILYLAGTEATTFTGPESDSYEQALEDVVDNLVFDESFSHGLVYNLETKETRTITRDEAYKIALTRGY